MSRFALRAGARCCVCTFHSLLAGRSCCILAVGLQRHLSSVSCCSCAYINMCVGVLQLVSSHSYISASINPVVWDELAADAVEQCQLAFPNATVAWVRAFCAIPARESSL